MPTPDRTSLPAIVDAARTLLEEGGPAGVTMQAVAGRVGVKAPSLYKRVRDRDALLGLVAEASADDIAARMAGISDLAGLARAFRDFARERPEAFRLMFTTAIDAAAAARTSAPVLAAAQAAVGEEHALDAARLLTAWATGFSSMELAGAFQLGGDVDAAFDYGLARIIASLGAQPRPALGPRG
jgi:AcrR family transcriptional regulator